MTIVLLIWNFLWSTIGRLLVIAVVAFGIGMHVRGKFDHSSELRAQVAAMKENVAQTQAVAASAAARAQAEAARAQALQKKVQDYADELAKRPTSAVCRASDLDARRLSGIR